MCVKKVRFHREDFYNAPAKWEDFKRGWGVCCPVPLNWSEPHDREVPHAREKKGAVCLSVSIRHMSAVYVYTHQSDRSHKEDEVYEGQA